jgi:DNA processing protein
MPLPVGEADDAEAWLRLALTPGLGPAGVRTLLERFGLPHAVFEAVRRGAAGDLPPRAAHALARPDDDRERRVAAALRWARSPVHHLVTLADADYPAWLLQIPDPPPLLHAVGRREVLSRPMVAVVGSRTPTAAGTALARDFAAALSRAGWTVASGLALGIDAAAHEGALAGGAGTLAVLATGVDVIYPSRHRALAERIAADGIVVSELPLGTPVSPGLFPRRNRLIAGAARAVVVVEAALASGSLITARQAADFGREVFAVPGSVHSPLARGCHALIRDGATLVETPDDVLAELPAVAHPLDPDTQPMGAAAAPAGARASATAARLAARRRQQLYASAHSHRKPLPTGARGPDADPILAAVGHEPVLPDTLADHLRLPAADLGAQLVILELSGHLVRLPDGRVVRPPPAR